MILMQFVAQCLNYIQCYQSNKIAIACKNKCFYDKNIILLYIILFYNNIIL